MKRRRNPLLLLLRVNYNQLETEARPKHREVDLIDQAYSKSIQNMGMIKCCLHPSVMMNTSMHYPAISFDFSVVVFLTFIFKGCLFALFLSVCVPI